MGLSLNLRLVKEKQNSADFKCELKPSFAPHFLLLANKRRNPHQPNNLKEYGGVTLKETQGV